MRLNQKLNLVIPVDTETRGEVWVHSTPIGREVFKKYYLVLSKTYAQIFGQGLSEVAGPRVANFMLEEVATNTMRNPAQNWWDGPDGVARGLMGEIRRLSNVTFSGEKGWETMPYYNAIQDKFFTDEEIDQLEGLITFFTVVSALMDPSGKEAALTGMKFLWAVQTTSLNSTEYAASLRTSTSDETSNTPAPPPELTTPMVEPEKTPEEAPLGIPLTREGTWSPPS